MATLEEIVVQLTAETAGLRAEMANATKAVQGSTDKMDKAIEEFSKNSSKNTSFFQQSMATMVGFLGSQAVLGAFGLAKDAAALFFDQLAGGVEAANAQEAALRKLGYSLAQSGNFTQSALDDLAAYTDQMEKLTGVGDDVVAANLSVLSSMTKLSSQGLKEAQTAALNLSATMGIDLDTATKKVAMAINGQDDALKKYGITLDVGADKTHNLSVLTDKLGSSLGNAAKGQLNTFSGAMTAAENGLGNFFEAIAVGITQNPVFIAALKEIASILGELTGSAEGNSKAIKEGLANAFLLMADILIVTTAAVDQFIRIMEAGIRSILLPVNALADGIRLLSDVITGADSGEAFANTKAQFEDLQNAVEGESMLGNLTDRLSQVRQAGASAFTDIGSAADTAVPQMDAVNNKTKELTESQQAYRDSLAAFSEGLANQNNELFSSLEFRAQMLEAQRTGEAESEAVYWEEKMALMNERFQAENDALAAARDQGLITEAQYTSAATALSQQHALAAQKASQDRIKFEKEEQKQRLQGYGTFFNGLAALSESSNKTLAGIGKAAAISKATIDAYLAIQNALANVPYPANIAAAAGIGIQAFANVSKIAGIGLKSGITEVPKSAGGGNNGDNFPAILKSGERVVDSDTNQDLKQFLNGGGGGGAVNINLNIQIMPGTGMNNEQVGNLVEQLNNYFTSGGLKLIGAV